MNQTLLILTVVCLVVASARMLHQDPWSAEVGAVRNLKEFDRGVEPRRRKRSFRFRGYWSCPIGYIRSPAAICVDCGEYEMITGISCDNVF